MARGLHRVFRIVGVVLVGLVAAALIAGAVGSWWFAPDSQVAKAYSLVPSTVDYDNDGIEDYSDLLLGARAEAKAAPAYDGGYYEGGYPPEDRGACTDTVWRAFATAGYDLKAMVDADIAHDPDAYAQVAPEPDPNIDFRRVGVLNTFFARYATSLSCDVADHAAWRAGDIVVFDGGEHIGIVSDQRDARGVPFIIHNMGQPFREEDYLAYPWSMKPTAHYRFDAVRIPAEVLIPYEGALPYQDQANAGGATSSTAAVLCISCYPELGPAGSSYTTDPDLIKQAWSLLALPGYLWANGDAGPSFGGGASGGYAASFSLVAAGGSTLASATLSTRGNVWYRTVAGVTLAYRDSNALNHFANTCIEQARAETYLAESEDRMLPASERTWLTPEEYEGTTS